ncbi:MAG TPA: hypothetical protein VIH57_05845 [Bacteroidales bacterium]
MERLGSRQTIFDLSIILVLFIFLCFFNTNIFCQQGIGCSLFFTTDKVFGGNVFYTVQKNSFYCGFSYQSNGQKRTVVRERKKTYGITPIGDGDYYWLIDLGYSRTFSKVIIQPEVSIGSKNYFTNYKDNRFKDDGYSLINYSIGIAGVGINIGYKVSDFIEPYIGFHSIKKLTLGIRIHFSFYSNTESKMKSNDI